MDDLVIEFKPTGQVEALHMDAFDLGFLGRKETHRQTDIVFDSETQKWNLEYFIECNPNHRYYAAELQGFESYEDARKIEVRWLNNCRLIGIDPISGAGVRIIAGIRKHG